MKNRIRIKSLIKLAIAHSLYAVGLLQLWQRIVLRKRAVVLMYHRVLTEEEMKVTGSHPAIVVKRETFATHMQAIKSRFKVLSIDQFVEHMEQKRPFENSSCLVTFDDGWGDNYKHALPILREHGIPALIFLPVNFVGASQIFWQEQLTHLIFQAIQRIDQDPSCRDRLIAILAPLISLELILNVSQDDLRSIVTDAVRKNKHLPLSLIRKTVAALDQELQVQWKQYQEIDGFLNWEQVRLMSHEGITWGGHGAEHKILTNVSRLEVEEEICTSKEILDTRLLIRVPTFSYPNGNWSVEIAKLIEKSGFRAAFTTIPGFVRCDDDRFTVRRINIFEEDTKTVPMFLARIVGLFR